ncbi:MAG TPA: TonB-dependent receptor [Candidatus Angelobacter sp.]|nr:TonB-dependent receptor [Candidatus Angelobacter sp.]
MNKRTFLLRFSRVPAFLLRLLGCFLLLCLSARADSGTNQTPDLADLDITNLMNIPVVFSASKFAQKATEAPSSTTVITSDQIKRYGWRTLGDLLESVQGFYISYDRNYQFLGARGVNLGDFNSRILLLVNGHRVNNDLNDGAFIDTAFILDLDLIDRVEIIRGPGSVLYGNNAFFGVINVITRQGKQVDGVEASTTYGSFNSYSGRATIGKQFTNGVQLMLSGSYYNSDGPENLFFRQFDTPAQNNGIAHKKDQDGYGSFFGSVGYRDFTLEGAYIDRVKGNPTAQYATTFDNSRLRTDDDRGYVVLKYAHQFNDDLDVSANAYYDRSDFGIQYPQPLLSAEKQTGQWAGLEAQVNKKIMGRHILTLGAEYRDDFDQSRRVFQPMSGGAFTNVDRSRRNYGIFAQGEFTIITNRLHLNAGVRYDQYGDFNPSVSPRAALIYNPVEQTTLKFIYGTAFRDPNFLELSAPNFQGIKPEKITSYEGVYEQEIGYGLRSSVSGYYNRMDDLIDFESGSFTNFNADTLGTELALEGKWKDGIQGRLSYTLQHTEYRETQRGLVDSPTHMVKLNVSVPVWQDKVFAGLEVQYTSARHTVFTDLLSGQTVPGGDAPGFTVVNLTLFSQNLAKNLEASAGIYNLLDTRYFDPASRFHLQNEIQQDGRTFRLKLTYRF